MFQNEHRNSITVKVTDSLAAQMALTSTNGNSPRTQVDHSSEQFPHWCTQTPSDHENVVRGGLSEKSPHTGMIPLESFHTVEHSGTSGSTQDILLGYPLWAI